MAEFSNVLRLINAVSNSYNSVVGTSEKALEEYFHNVFKDEKTYEEFYKRGCYEMSEELFEYTKLHIGTTEIGEDEEDYIFSIINPLANPYLSVIDSFSMSLQKCCTMRVAMLEETLTIMILRVFTNIWTRMFLSADTLK